MKTLSIHSRGCILSSFIFLFTLGFVSFALAGNEFPSNDDKVVEGTLHSASVVKEFEVKKGKAGIQLSWKAASIHAAPSFDVERSVSGSSFVKIASFKSGKSAVYNFTDKNIFQPAYYYRIRIKVVTGESFFSETIYISAKTGKTSVKHSSSVAASNRDEKKIEIAKKTTVITTAPAEEKIIYNLCVEEFSKIPVYFNDELEMVVHAEKDGILSVNLTGLNGRVRFQRSFMADAGYNHIAMEDLSPLPRGNYTMTVKTGKQFISRKAIKQ